MLYIAMVVCALLMLYAVLYMNPYLIMIAIFIVILMPILQIFS